MKKSVLLIVCLFFIAKGITYSQTNFLLGMTANGGANNGGVIFKIKYDGSGFKVLYSFVSSTGRNPYGNLIKATNGLFYGTADSGGSKKGGVIFSFDTTTNKYTDVFNFSRTDAGGCYPGGTLVQASDGKLYGMTGAGGANNLGVLFKFNPANNRYTKLVDFYGPNGAIPRHNSLIQAGNGLLYGLTAQGGQDNFGVFFSYNLINSTYNSYNMAKNGDGWPAIYPNGRLIESSDGLLRGTTVSLNNICGINRVAEGTLIAFNPANNAGTIQYDFGSSLCDGAIANGAYPYGSLIEQSAGVFYGMNSGDAAYALPPNIFKFQSSNKVVTELFDFNVIDGLLPYGSLITANDGNLYGMTWSGGASNYGVVFRFNPANNSYLKIHDFDGAHGANPYADLIICNLPPKPGFITGNIVFCPGSTQTYTIEPVAGATSYKWTVPEGSSIQGAKTGVSITVLMGNTSGSITVKAKNPCGISPAYSKSLILHCATALTKQQVAFESGVKISPNPTSANITVQFSSSYKNNYSLKLIDIVGNPVMNRQGIAVPGLNTIYLDLSKFVKGVYMVQLQSGYNKEVIKKIVLQ